jgi:hypothetical protein
MKKKTKKPTLKYKTGQSVEAAGMQNWGKIDKFHPLGLYLVVDYEDNRWILTEEDLDKISHATHCPTPGEYFQVPVSRRGEGDICMKCAELHDTKTRELEKSIEYMDKTNRDLHAHCNDLVKDLGELRAKYEEECRTAQTLSDQNRKLRKLVDFLVALDTRG